MMRTLLTAILMLLVTPALAQPVCDADIAEPIGVLDGADQTEFVSRAAAMDPSADWDGSGTIDFFDVLAFLRDFDACEDSPQVIVLRDSIGPDSTQTDFNWYYTTTSTPGGNDGISITPFFVEQGVTLASYRTVLVGNGFTYDWNAFDYEVRIWDSMADAEADPRCLQPECQSLWFDAPSEGPQPFGTTNFAPFGDRATYEFTFDLLPFDVQVQAASSKVIGLTVYTPGGPAGSAMVMESDESGALTDREGLNGSWTFTSDDPQSFHDGRIAVELRAETLP